MMPQSPNPSIAPLRVLHVNPGNMFGGVERMLMTIAEHAPSAPGMRSEFAVCFDHAWSDSLRAGGAMVHRLPSVRLSRPWTVWRSRRALRRQLDNPLTRPDVVVCHATWSICVYAAAVRQARLPLVIFLHDPPGEQLHWIERRAQGWPVDLVLCNSRYTAERGAKLFRPSTPMKIVHCPVPPPKRSTQGMKRQAIRAKWGAVDETCVILQVGRWQPHKGHDTLLSALEKLLDRDDWICVQVGAPQRDEERAYFDGIVRRTAKLGLEARVRFVGWLPDVQEAIDASDVYCQANLGAEPFGIAIAEALYSGLPVVASDAGGPREIVTSDCGVLVPPGDADALAAALRSLIADRHWRARLAAGGPNRASKLCDPATQLRQLELELRRCISMAV